MLRDFWFYEEVHKVFVLLRIDRRNSVYFLPNCQFRRALNYAIATQLSIPGDIY
ncbi:MAG TPA: hypothetical protein V6C64_02165 [Microcoleaceae cyanobacterium]